MAKLREKIVKYRVLVLIFGILQGIHIMRQKEVEEFERDRREEQEKNRAAARKRSETTVRNREKVARTKS